MERCFQTFGNPMKAFEHMDKDHDGLLTADEWAAGAAKMKLKPDQVARLFKNMDSNHKENTGHHVSKWEFYSYLDYEEPAFRSFNDGYGDIDAFGSDHKQFNKLTD